LGLVPKGWGVGKIADIGEVICGKTPPTSELANYGEDIPFITIPDMHNSLVITSTNRSLSTVGANTQKKKTLPIGSVCVSCIATAGLVARVTTPSQTNQQINSVVPLAKWGNSFTLFTLRLIGDAVRAGGSGGSVFHNLNKSGFEQLKVLFPCEELALAFNGIVEPIVEKIISNQQQAQTLANLRDTLLPRLISGQLQLSELKSNLNKVTI
jgi:type I restriction enzyme S subunit